MVVTLSEMKNYLRVDHDDDDTLLRNIMESAQKICMDVARTEDEDAFEEEYELEKYLFNHMDHHDVVDYLQERYKDVRFYTYEDERVR